VNALSHEALHVTCRALADMGEDYGWHVYYRGYTIPEHEERRMLEQDENAAAWLEAFRAASAAYQQATGEAWRY